MKLGSLALGMAAAMPGALAAQDLCGHQSLATHVAHYCVTGSGGPTIVLAAGAGSTSATWDGLTDPLADLGTVVTFDRAGLGASSTSAAPRTPSQIASELLELLEAAELAGPYILVGHSAGGWHILRFVELFPERVLGVVLVDTPPAEFETARLELLTPDEREERIRLLAETDASSPDIVRRERRDTRSELVRGFLPLPPSVRLVVVSANGQDFGNARTQKAHRDLWVRLSRDWLALSDTAEFLVAHGSGHMVHQERPALLVELIRHLVARAGSA